MQTSQFATHRQQSRTVKYARIVLHGLRISERRRAGGWRAEAGTPVAAA
jgi:hypothetical protein